MHIFLTGEIRVGKSTIIQKLITNLGLSADGFCTYWERDSDDTRCLYLSSCAETLQAGGRYLLARDDSGGFIRAGNIDKTFDSEGVKALKNSGSRDVTVMDELGFLESNAAEFQIAVLNRLSMQNPVFGVIKPTHTGFLDAVRRHPNVELHTVTPQNRDELYAKLFALYRDEVKGLKVAVVGHFPSLE